MQFISWMLAPEASSARFTAIRSSSVRPGAGSVVSADPPPETRNSTRSSGRQPRHRIEHPPRPGGAGGVGDGVGGFQHLDPRRRMAVRRSG